MTFERYKIGNMITDFLKISNWIRPMFHPLLILLGVNVIVIVTSEVKKLLRPLILVKLSQVYLGPSYKPVIKNFV